MKGNNLIVNIVTFIFSIVFLVYALQLPSASGNEIIGPKGWPTFLLLLMCVLSACSIISHFFFKKDNHDQSSESLGVSNRLIIVVILMAVYIALMPITGFLISTVLLVFLLAALFGMNRVWKLLTTSLVSGIAINYIFVSLLLLPLPKGISIFQEISLLFNLK